MGLLRPIELGEAEGRAENSRVLALELGRFVERISVKGDDELTDLQARGEISFTDGRVIPVWFDLADRLAPELLAEKLQRKSSTIIGKASAAIWSLHPRLGQLGARDIAKALLAAHV